MKKRQTAWKINGDHCDQKDFPKRFPIVVLQSTKKKKKMVCKRLNCGLQKIKFWVAKNIVSLQMIFVVLQKIFLLCK
jgi:hypothetical protein